MKIYPHLWFQGQAEEAMAFHQSIFKDSTVPERIVLPDPELSVIRFALAGLPGVRRCKRPERSFSHGDR
ncbi:MULTISPECIES: VOC family protein [unclassified Rhizobium]|uniref:VOC family protein n=1 Tax=unclassified Rhizobium TaxID=2613769 RepID=UPI000700925B|nr:MULTISPECIES: VOC family protein [unclassified Rhizobium]KQV41725.1 hypothetical protein ASC86_20115 [Rhizobium sp. Root1212]KRD32241.1 hypothetical protein ASE37_22755 [Rhizobium sp. Root268]